MSLGTEPRATLSPLVRSVIGEGDSMYSVVVGVFTNFLESRR